MAPYPQDLIVVAEARRLAAELDRELHDVAALLAAAGHHGPDGEPYPIRIIGNLLDEDLKRRRSERFQERNAAAFAAWNHYRQEQASVDLPAQASDPEIATPPACPVNAMALPGCVAAEDYPLTMEEAWMVMRGYRVRPRQPISLEALHAMPGPLELVDGTIRLRL